VHSERATVVVIAQAHYPCWRAFVDGKPVTLWRANHAFQAVAVPAGSHHVRLVYRDNWFALGCVISIATAAAHALAWFWRWKKLCLGQ